MAALTALRCRRGTSTLELLVATAFAATVVAQTALWTRTALEAQRGRDTAAGWERTAWLALESVATDLRDAGFHAAGDPLAGLAAAAEQSLLLLSDLDGDGTSDGSGERVGYVYDDAAGTLRRSTGQAAAQAMAEPAEGITLRFAFTDAAGNPLVPGATGLSASQRAVVRRVDLAFVEVESGRERVRTSIHLRNPP